MDGVTQWLSIDASQVEDGDGGGVRMDVTIQLEAVRYDTATGLVPVVVQDAHSRDVLMQAYANREALKRTLATGQAWFWSRSRSEYWRKGATSGNTLIVREVRLDCDSDSVLFIADAAGPTCHTGEQSCFFRKIVRDTEAKLAPALRAADSAIAADTGAAHRRTEDAGEGRAEDAGKGRNNDGNVRSTDRAAEFGDGTALAELWGVLTDRWWDLPAGSYTSYLYAGGVDRLAKKVGEEAVEVAIAAKNAVAAGDPPDMRCADNGQTELVKEQTELIKESADLLYHLLALWRGTGVRPQDVWRELRGRSGSIDDE